MARTETSGRVAGFVEHAASDDGSGVIAILKSAFCWPALRVMLGAAADESGVRGVQIIGAWTDVVDGLVAGEASLMAP